MSDPVDVDRLLRNVERLERRAAAIPSWQKGHIVFADHPSAFCPNPECSFESGHRTHCEDQFLTKGSDECPGTSCCPPAPVV